MLPSCPDPALLPGTQSLELCHSVMIYLTRLLSCPGNSTRTCNRYVAGRGHVYTAQHSAASDTHLAGREPAYLRGTAEHTAKSQPELSSHAQAHKGDSLAQHCTCRAGVPQPSRMSASREIFVLISAVAGWHSLQRWLHCPAFSWWQNELISQPLLCGNCRNIICSFPFLTEHCLKSR